MLNGPICFAPQNKCSLLYVSYIKNKLVGLGLNDLSWLSFTSVISLIHWVIDGY